MGANKERGEVALVVGDETYVLKLTSNAMCEMEAASGKTVVQIISSLQGGASASVTATRWWLWGLLRARHPQLSLLDVGDLIDRAGGLTAIGAKISEVYALNTEEATKAAPSGENPPEAQGGTGGDSILTPAVLA